MKRPDEVRISCYLSRNMKFYVSTHAGENVIRCIYVVPTTPVPQLRCSVWKRIDGKIMGLYLRCKALGGLKDEWDSPTYEFAPLIHRVFEQLTVDNAFEEIVLGIDYGRK